MKKFFALTLLPLALFFGLMAATPVSAHTQLTCVDILGHASFTSGNVCPNGARISQALRCVEADGVIIDVQADTCPAGDVILSNDGLSFGGPFGARFFPAGFDFGSLSDQRAAQDANACAAAIAFIQTLNLGPRHRAVADGLIAQLQGCQNNTGVNSTVSSPFTPAGFRCFGYYCY